MGSSNKDASLAGVTTYVHVHSFSCQAPVTQSGFASSLLAGIMDDEFDDDNVGGERAAGDAMQRAQTQQGAAEEGSEPEAVSSDEEPDEDEEEEDVGDGEVASLKEELWSDEDESDRVFKEGEHGRHPVVASMVLLRPAA
jgi:hypothetical protein